MNSATNLGTAGDRTRSVQVYGGTWELVTALPGMAGVSRWLTTSLICGVSVCEMVWRPREKSRRRAAGARGIRRLADWKIYASSSNLPMVCTGKPTAFISAKALLCVTGPGFIL